MDCSNTPTDSQITSIQFKGQILYVNQPSSGKINVSFVDISQKYKYQLKQHTLEKINFKTVLAALKGNHPQIISADLLKNQKQFFQLIVKVSYQFLPQIVQVLVLEKKELPADQTQQAVVRNLRNYVRGIKEQLNSIGSIQVMQGKFQESQSTEVFVKLNHKDTVFTWVLNFVNISVTTVKLQMYYYSSITKQRKSSGVVPQQGIYIHHNSSNAYCELKFYANQDEFDMVIFQLQGKHNGNYILTSQKVQRS